MADDHRREVTRVTSRIRARVTMEKGEPQGAECENLSLLGVLLRTPGPLPLGAVCSVRLVLDGGESDVTLSGTVVRQTACGGAIRFDSVVGADAVEHLHNLILYNSHEPAQVASEFQGHLGLRRGP